MILRTSPGGGTTKFQKRRRLCTGAPLGALRCSEVRTSSKGGPPSRLKQGTTGCGCFGPSTRPKPTAKRGLGWTRPGPKQPQPVVPCLSLDGGPPLERVLWSTSEPQNILGHQEGRRCIVCAVFGTSP